MAGLSINGYPNGNWSNGGFSWTEDNYDPSVGAVSGSDILGRWWNNISGTTANNQFNAAEAEKTRLYNSAEAAKEREWQTMMSNTAYQRAADDMKAAGINPASLGGNATMSPASSGSGATAHAEAARATANSGGGFLGALIQGYKAALYNKVARSAISSREGIAEANRESREAIADANRVSRESIARDKLSSVESEKSKDRIFKSTEAEKEREFRHDENTRKGDLEYDKLQIKNVMNDMNNNLKRELHSARMADAAVKNELKAQELADKRQYNKYHGFNEHLTFLRRVKKGRKG